MRMLKMFIPSPPVPADSANHCFYFVANNTLTRRIADISPVDACKALISVETSILNNTLELSWTQVFLPLDGTHFIFLHNNALSHPPQDGFQWPNSPFVQLVSLNGKEELKLIRMAGGYSTGRSGLLKTHYQRVHGKLPLELVYYSQLYGLDVSNAFATSRHQVYLNTRNDPGDGGNSTPTSELLPSASTRERFFFGTSRLLLVYLYSILF
ncbi:uncharacterized protein LOC135120463 [Zophobas morio]|uniref:uncharacterized protein LOC135120463 n=1 Tax=Zophobas morio TaxID=2755281 RepID=UPI0030839AF4